MGNNYDKNNREHHSEKPKDFSPIPAEQVQKLSNPNANFSLCSPRLVKWKKEKNELKPSTNSIENLSSVFNSKTLFDAIANKQAKQSSYLDSLKKLGVQTFSIKAKTTSPFITGLGSGHPTETGMILDRNIGVPYIPASSIKGVLRLAHAINIANGQKEVPDSELEKYFGTADTKQKEQYRGQLVFLDAYPARDIQLHVDIMNPHYTKYYDGTNKQPVETESPVPIKFLTVKEGTEFIFHCAFMPLNLSDKCDEDEIEAMYDTAFERVGFGGKTSIGYGRFARSDKKIDMTNQSEATKKETKALAAGEYEAIIEEVERGRRKTIHFLIEGKYKAIKANCSDKIIKRYNKKDKVKIKIDGTKDKEGNYLVTEILSN
ncbi:MAG: type III-B CRISPR module RAMP protein Cmr6 [Spirochaetota bacterium]|nr:type III-B CRISPR module RAMP protein Cmr6 [Spirochaetota bacterium]